MTSGIENLSAEELLRETAWLEGLSRQLVADPHQAADIAQDSWVALTRHDKPIKRIRPWLSRVARNFAARLTLRESQRMGREAAAARPEAQPSAAESVERVRIQNRVVAALLQLSEPHRTTVILRFFEDLPPREIATRMGVPVGTVRSRLRAGLARMRAELDRELSSRAAWVAPLVTYYEALPAHGLLLGLIMKAKTITAAAAVLLASGLGYLLLSTASPVTDSSGSGAAGPVANAAGDLGQEPQATGAASLDPRVPETRGERTAIALSPDMVTIMGRCVEATTSAPISRITARVTPMAPRRVSARETPADITEPLPVETSLDGRFALTFETAPGWRFAIELSGAGIVPLITPAQPLDPGTLDLGTVEVMLGKVVRGRLVDDAGQPLADQRVRVDKGHIRFEEAMFTEAMGTAVAMSPAPSFRQRASFSAMTGPDGMFEIPDPVPPDDWVVHLWERRKLLEETLLEIRPSEAAKWIDLTAESAVDALSGAVVDDLGRPIKEASVTFTLSTGAKWTLSTGQDGTFRTPGFARDPDEPVTVSASKTGHTGPDPAKHEWGSSIEIELARGGIVDIFVSDSETGRPVPDYGVRIFRTPETNATANDALLRYIGTHEAGLLQVSGVLPGQNLVMVEPARIDLEPSWFEPVQVTGGEVSRIEIPLQAAVTRSVRIEGGHPADYAGK